jgi:hypothetical protein
VVDVGSAAFAVDVALAAFSVDVAFAVDAVDAVPDCLPAFPPQPATSTTEHNAAIAALVTPMLQSPESAPA